MDGRSLDVGGGGDTRDVTRRGDPREVHTEGRNATRERRTDKSEDPTEAETDLPTSEVKVEDGERVYGLR